MDAPTGIRTPVVALKGLRPSPLDDGGVCSRGVLRNRSMSGRILSFPNITVKQIHYLTFVVTTSVVRSITTEVVTTLLSFILFHALTQQTQYINFFTVKENSRAFHFEIRH